eukprot:scaffold745_cov71-Skeletonema_dohrnii-CCMP3373.AAC.2
MEGCVTRLNSVESCFVKSKGILPPLSKILTAKRMPSTSNLIAYYIWGMEYGLRALHASSLTPSHNQKTIIMQDTGEVLHAHILTLLFTFSSFIRTQ